MTMHALLKNKYINRWHLFWLISTPISALVIIELLSTDVSTGAGVSHMIGYAVRFAVPLVFIVVGISALQALFPGPATGWLLRNRKYIGLSFAVAMAWQGLFIFTMSMFFRDYYYEDVYLLRDELEGSVGYIFLPAMVVTSFHFGRKYLSQNQWKLLHTSGLYFLWGYPFVVYWFAAAHYYGEPATFEWVYYAMGFLAFLARIAAWGKRRLKQALKTSPDSSVPLGRRFLGGALIGFGLYAAATGAQWREAVSGWLLSADWSARLELWLPYWPFEPFLPLFVVGLGTMLATMVTVPQKSAAVAV